ncbi:hypothetical protein B0H13DRAFT_1575438, partial [Mycena leptocephala]
LCPFCDSLLPVSPSEILLNMIAKAQSVASSDPRPENSKGLLPTTLLCAPICSRHHFERDLFPMALQRGWKTELDFPDIERRLKQKKSVFDALIND